MNFEKPDRMPAVHFGYWSETLKEWAEQGCIPKTILQNHWDNSDSDHALDKIIGWDFAWSCAVGPQIGLKPAFEKKILEKLPGGFLRVQNTIGVTERIKEGVESIPAEDDYLLKDRKAFEKYYKPKMQYSPDRVDFAYFNDYNKKNIEAHPRAIWVGSLLGDIRNMLSVVGMSYMICDDYDLLKEIVATYADMQYQALSELFKTGAKFDVAQYWEDICFKNGPLISPTMFEDLCFEHYQKRNKLLNDHGCNIISLDCDGVTEALLPTWFHSGVNTMFPIEIGVWGDQFENARVKFGKGMLGVGGMDKTCFRKDKQAVDIELKRMEKLAKLGGFIPCPDHRIMPGSKFELVKYYAKKIKEIDV